MTLPSPPVSAECDCSDLDGFMLNVERLMASELVALATHEELAAAFLLWCRAWKQRPASSLPDDERVLASFARLPLARFRKVREMALRGFLKCSDGRLYHQVLAAEAMRAWERKIAFRKRRETDNARLKKWRAGRQLGASETAPETAEETGHETRFAAEGQVQGQGQYYSSPYGEASGNEELPFDNSAVPEPPPPEPDAKMRLWSEGLGILRRLTGKPDNQARRLLGRFEQQAKRDHDGLLAALRRAESDPPAEPEAWIMAAASSLGGRRRKPISNVPILPPMFDPPDAWGVRDWALRQPDLTCSDDEYDICGLIVEVVAQLLLNAARVPVEARPNLDALGQWAREGIFPTHETYREIGDMAARMDTPVRSLALFDAVVRRTAWRAVA